MFIEPQELLFCFFDGVLELPTILEVDRFATTACAEGVENDIPGNRIRVEATLFERLRGRLETSDLISVMPLFALDIVRYGFFEIGHDRLRDICFSFSDDLHPLRKRRVI